MFISNTQGDRSLMDASNRNDERGIEHASFDDFLQLLHSSLTSWKKWITRSSKKKSIVSIMPARITTSPAVRRELRTLGASLREARLRRRLTQELVAERAGMTRPTLRRAERGDPSVSAGSYALILQSLGLLDGWGKIDDLLGDRLAIEQLPKAIRPRK